eukprot:maker-scaffold25_size650667-snap-gene-5.29 protein:Tk06713 transcript:maker-scaffold25_size650667-snap-gene-5.29-mRNA-1 annotation:"gtp-binding protein cg1354"
MPPKKKEIEEKPVIIGRMGTNLKCGIVGLPNPRRVPVPDTRYDFLVEYFKPASKVPAFLNVTDIAGLVKGASEGQGLGNAFLSHIKACDAMFHLCRTFEDSEITHVEGEVDPVRDLDIINEELRLKDAEGFNKVFEELERKYTRGEKKLKLEYDIMCKVKDVLIDQGKHIRFGEWNGTDIELLNKHLFITAKPMIYLVNLSEKDFIRKKNKWLPKIKEYVDKHDPGAMIIPFSGAFESTLMDMATDEERNAHCKEVKCERLPKIKEYVDKHDPGAMIIPFSGAFESTLMDMATDEERNAHCKEVKCESALEKIIIQGYKALQLMYFFTSGEDEVKAWTIQKNTKAPQAAGRIHTDFEKGFIMAEVMKFEDFKEEGSELACKAGGKYRQQGRNYVVEDGDIIFFKFNAGAGLTATKKK